MQEEGIQENGVSTKGMARGRAGHNVCVHGVIRIQHGIRLSEGYVHRQRTAVLSATQRPRGGGGGGCAGR